MREFRLGESYALFPRITVLIYTYLKSKNNRSRTLFCFVYPISFLLFSNHLASAQSTDPLQAGNGRLDIPELRVDDSIPERLWDSPMQFVEGLKTIPTFSLRNYQHKRLIVLDFWATWCASCLENIQKIKSLENHYGDSVLFLAVNSETTKDTRERIDKTFSKFRSENNSNDIGYILSDKFLYKYFPHKTLPHIVWILDGKYIGSTYAEAVTSNHIDAVLSSGRLQQSVKNEILSFDPSLMINSQLDSKTNLVLQDNVFFSEYIDGIGFDSGTFYKTQTGYLYRISNYDLVYYYYLAYPEVFKNVESTDITYDREVGESFITKIVSPVQYQDGFCFEFFSSDSLKFDDVKQELTRILERKFQTKPHRHSVKKSYIQLQLHQKVKRRGNQTEDQGDFESVSWGNLVRQLSAESNTAIIDSTGIQTDAHFQIPSSYSKDQKSIDAILSYLGVSARMINKNVPAVTFKTVHN